MTGTQFKFNKSLDFVRLIKIFCLGLFFSFPARFQTVGKLNKGSLLRVANLWGGIYNWSAFLSSRSGRRSLFVCHVLLKDIGRRLCLKLCINLRILSSIN